MTSNAISFDLRTRDVDVGATVALWICGAVREACARQAIANVVVVDDGVLGPPLRRSRHGRATSPAVAIHRGRTLDISVSSSLLFVRRRRAIETVRTISNAWLAPRDTISLDHFDVVARQRTVLAPVCAALNTAAGPSRFLLRVDDFPCVGADLDDFRRFDAIAEEHEIPYLLGVTPFLDRGHGRGRLTADECRTLRGCAPRVSFALHGFTHASRYDNYGSELAFLSPRELSAHLDDAEAFLDDVGLSTRAFVAPFNSYDAHTLGILASRFAILCGGPESAASVGYRVGPSFLLGTLYVPSYRGAYDVACDNLAGLDALSAAADGMVVPVTIHWRNERRSKFEYFRQLCRRLQGRTECWDDLIARWHWVQRLANSPTDSRRLSAAHFPSAVLFGRKP